VTTLTLQLQPKAPLEADAVTPDNFCGKSASEIARLRVMHGNEPASIGDFFRVEGGGAEEIVLHGDLIRVKSIASGMTRGKVVIHGNAGMHLGAGMRGGEILVLGDAGDWAGAEMTGGKIHIRGNAGHGLGGAYRGSRRGMNRGFVLVEGDAGHEAGAAMRRGLIVIMGDAGDFAGAFMTAGTIIVFGSLGLRSGAGSLRGTIVAFRPPQLLPTYRYDCRYQPDFLKVIFCELQSHGLSIPPDYASGFYRRYSGDFNRLGKGEILIFEQKGDSHQCPRQ
jgi:formylmethanofuran dehydrogenase subunit C